MLERRRNLKEIGFLYKRVPTNDGCCVYCGDTATCYDHVPPISVVAKIDLKELENRNIELILYPSCRYCNSSLGSKKLGTLQERLSYLYTKTQTLIDTLDIRWQEDEIVELGYNMKQVVLNTIKRAEWLSERLHGITYRLSCLEEDN